MVLPLGSIALSTRRSGSGSQLRPKASVIARCNFMFRIGTVLSSSRVMLYLGISHGLGGLHGGVSGGCGEGVGGGSSSEVHAPDDAQHLQSIRGLPLGPTGLSLP